MAKITLVLLVIVYIVTIGIFIREMIRDFEEHLD